MTAVIPSPWPDAEMLRFQETFIYGPEAFLVDEVLSADAEAKVLEATFDTTRPLPISAAQRGDPARHPRHVSGPELMLATGSLGCLHAFFFHGCHWDAGWVGFGSRVHRIDFREIAYIGPPLHLRSEETRTRVGPKRVMLRLAFSFSQGGREVYRGDQSALFVHEPTFEAPGA